MNASKSSSSSPLSTTPPVALTIAGSDSGGGAGIQADLKTFAAFGVYGCSALTALTAQNTLGVQGVHPVPPEFVIAQVDSVLADFSPAAIKTGMLANAEIIAALARRLQTLQQTENGAPALVLDPVMLATSGDRLLQREAEARLIEQLFPLATLITPNLPEAAALLGESEAETREQSWHQAQRLLALGPQAVLLKGGHADGPEAADLLLTRDGAQTVFSLPRLDTHNNHGSGCSLAAAIAAGLARGTSLPTAVGDAKAYLHRAMDSGARWDLGQGCGPLHHFYHLRPFERHQDLAHSSSAHPSSAHATLTQPSGD